MIHSWLNCELYNQKKLNILVQRLVLKIEYKDITIFGNLCSFFRVFCL